MNYEAKLKQAFKVQAEDEEELSHNLLRPLHTASQVQQRSERDAGKQRDVNREQPISKSQEEQHREMLEAERLRRQVMMQEISSIHCSGTRDKNTH
jgi:transposase